MTTQLKKTGLQGVSSTSGVGDSKHSFSETEKNAYIDFVNRTLADDTDVQAQVPLSPSGDAWLDIIATGVLLPKLIKTSFPDVDVVGLALAPKNAFEINQNHDICLKVAKEVGCNLVNIGATDLTEKKVHLVMAVLWQIIRISMLKNVVTSFEHEDGIEDLTPEAILLRWVNTHLGRIGYTKVVKGFGSGLNDSEAYCMLMAAIAREHVSISDAETVLRELNLETRAELMLQLADRLGCRKFVTPKDVVEGNPRLNLAFTATLFNAFPSLGPTPEELAAQRVKQVEEQLANLSSRLGEMERSKSELEGNLNDAIQQKNRLEKVVSEKDTSLQSTTEAYQQTSSARQQLEAQLAAALRALEDERNARLNADLASQKQIASLTAELEQSRAQATQHLEATMNSYQLQLQRLHAEKEQSLTVLQQASSDEVESLKQTIAQLQQRIDELEALVSSLEDARAQLRKELEERNFRVAELEQGLSELAKRMETSLTGAERQRLEQLANAERAKQEALMRAQSERDQELEKMRMLLTGNTRSGYLLKLSTHSLIAGWKKRWFVLHDHVLAYYKDNKSEQDRPLRVIHVEKLRIYTLDEKDVKRKHSFMITEEGAQDNDKEGKSVTLAASSEAEMREWMDSIATQKKKRIGAAVLTK
eukprot:TRINITY_DN8394_c0_g1_i1.p1 TRINITY_DN8394_c0_g1~~TRINITY_DN8394_c0_g1_i1.p1  ORF type:complete len:660 (+),score=33.47 TRINITY_DN8394_c0_g1_i1:38-1981(+)